MVSRIVHPFMLLCGTVLSTTVTANDCMNSTTTSTTMPCETTDQLHLSVAMGAGFRSNPLHGGRHFPLWLMPDIAYYSQHWFFDNGTLGTSWTLNNTLTLSLVSRFNEEQGYFRRSAPSNLISSGQRIGNAEEAGPFQQQESSFDGAYVDISQVEKRPWALDGGLQLDWQQSNWQLRANWWHDLSQEYQGSHAKITAAYHLSHQTGDWGMSAALAWKSAKLLNRYYGLSEADGGNPDVAVAGLQPEVGIHWSYALDAQWSLLSLYRYRWLQIDLKNTQDAAAAVEQSPLLAESFVRSWFFGVSYRFY